MFGSVSSSEERQALVGSIHASIFEAMQQDAAGRYSEAGMRGGPDCFQGEKDRICRLIMAVLHWLQMPATASSSSSSKGMARRLVARAARRRTRCVCLDEGFRSNLQGTSR